MRFDISKKKKKKEENGIIVTYIHYYLLESGISNFRYLYLFYLYRYQIPIFFLDSDSSTSPSESESCSSQTERSATTTSHIPPQLAAKRLSLGFALATRTHHYGSFYLRMGAVGKYEQSIKIIIVYT